MSPLRNLWAGLLALFQKKQFEREMDEELNGYLDAAARDKMRAGMSREEALRAARVEMGSVDAVKEEIRSAGWESTLETLWQDVRYGSRQLRRNPGFTMVAVLTLALGIGVTTSIFSILNGAALRPVQLPDSERLVTVYQNFRGQISRKVYGGLGLFSYSEYLDYRDHNQVFSGLLAYEPSFAASLGGERPQQIYGDFVSCNYFTVLAVQPAPGRSFFDSECAAPGASPVVVLSDTLWRSAFAADPRIVGKVITLNRNKFTVVGIAPAGFTGTEIFPATFWAPLTMRGSVESGDNRLGDANLGWLVLLGRVKPGISPAQVRAELAVIASRIDQLYPGRQTTLAIHIATFLSAPEEHKIALTIGTIILCTVGLVLLIACANVANLLLARAAARRKEIAVRLALGAGRGRLVRQLLTESFLIALLGGGLGSLVAFASSAAGVKLLMAHLPPGTPPLVLNVAPDLRVLAFTMILTLITGIAFGLVPALQASRPELNTALKDGGADSAGGAPDGGFLRKAMVAAQVAVCMVLLIAAGLLMRGVYRAQTIDPGFETKNVLVASFDLNGQGYNEQRAGTFQHLLMERLAALPGVDSVAQAARAPLSLAIDQTTLTSSGQGGDLNVEVEYNTVSSSFFSLLGIPIVRGRDFTAAETQSASNVVIVTESTARRFWPGQDPIGKTLTPRGEGFSTLEVVGVAKDVQVSHPGESETIYLYLPAGPKSQPGMELLVHSSAGFATTAQAIKRAIHSFDSEMPSNVVKLEDNFERWRTPSRIAAVLFGALGALALLLASMGVYGMVSFTASRRTREIGIRMTLGANRRDVLQLVIGQAMRPVIVGAAVGIVCCAAVSRVLSSLLFGISALDPISFLSVAAFLLAAALLACYIPARRATKVDPMVALRYE